MNQLLPSNSRFRVYWCNRNRLKNSFVHQSIQLLNKAKWNFQRIYDSIAISLRMTLFICLTCPLVFVWAVGCAMSCVWHRLTGSHLCLPKMLSVLLVYRCAVVSFVPGYLYVLNVLRGLPRDTMHFSAIWTDKVVLYRAVLYRSSHGLLTPPTSPGPVSPGEGTAQGLYVWPRGWGRVWPRHHQH